MRRSGAAWTRALLLQLLLAGPGGCLSRQELFPFGPGHGDQELEAGDDRVSPALELRRPLRFFDKSGIDSVYVSATSGAGGGGGRGGRRGAEQPSEGWRGPTGRPAGSDGRGRRGRGRGVSGPSRAPRVPRAADVSAPPGRCRRRSTRVWGAPVCAASRVPCPTGKRRHRGTPGPRAESPLRQLWAAPPPGSRASSRRRPGPAGTGRGRGGAPRGRGAFAGQRPERGPGTCVGAGAGKDSGSGRLRADPGPVLAESPLPAELVSVQGFGLGKQGDPEVQSPVAERCHHGGPHRGAGPDGL